jgi:hypothetical protein
MGSQVVPEVQITSAQALAGRQERSTSAQPVPASEPGGQPQVEPPGQTAPLHLHRPSAGSQVVLPRHFTPEQRSAMHSLRVDSMTAHDWPGAHAAFPQVQLPVVTSHVWFTGQTTPSQRLDDSHIRVAGLQASPGAQRVPAVPPHLHLPSSESQLVPPRQITVAQRAEMQVFVPRSHADP